MNGHLYSNRAKQGTFWKILQNTLWTEICLPSTDVLFPMYCFGDKPLAQMKQEIVKLRTFLKVF